jgi:hypothetical protein
MVPVSSRPKPSRAPPTSIRPSTPTELALPIAGDDQVPKEAVAAFLDAVGYDCVDAGTLAITRPGGQLVDDRRANCTDSGSERLV